MKNIIKRLINLFGLELSNLEAVKKSAVLLSENQKEKLEFELCLNKILFLFDKYTATNNDLKIHEFLKFSSDKLVKSKSQIFQDLFVLYSLKEKRNGYFIEFGATNGVSLSNSYLLEKEYDWKGILAEPARIWESELRKSRNCFIDDRCVWVDSNSQLTFNETMNPELSQVDSHSNNDFMSCKRNIYISYQVSTVSLNDLLETYKAPADIDYLSIDTEGSEYEILKAFNFEKFSIKIITVEHNYTSKREEIFNLLKSKGYKRVFEKISVFDDWYIKE